MNSIAPKISVIVPVYNVEKYLRRCVDSILSQTFTDFELLLIDDGSSDESGEICDEYKRKDIRVKVFHQENGGICVARQKGVDESKGVYSIHVDSDDHIKVTMLEEMYCIAVKENADVVLTDYYEVDFKGTIKYINQSVQNSSIECLKEILIENIHGSLCNKLIRHSLYKQFNVFFPIGNNMSEDVCICAQILPNIKRLVYLPNAYYYYCYNEKSYSNTFMSSDIDAKFRFMDFLSNLLKNDGQFQESLLIAKVAVKMSVMNNCDFKYLKTLSNKYPESNPYVFKFKKFHIINSFALWLVNRRILFLSFALVYLKKRLNFLKKIPFVCGK